MAAAGGDWGIVGGGAALGRDMVDALAAQDCLFSVTTLGPDAARRAGRRVAGRRAPPAHVRPSDVLALFADPRVRVVTLTVTEKAYLLDAAGRPLLLATSCGPTSPPTGRRGPCPGCWRGRCGAARPRRRRRRSRWSAATTCRQRRPPAHGARTRARRPARATGCRSRTRWSTASCRPPPRPPSARAQAALGVVDLAAVEAEPYRQWVIEDDFPGGRPAWERAGAVLTGDVAAYERLKLRMLNGVHSTVAYLGALAGCATIAEALRAARDGGVPAAPCCADDVAPTLRPPAGVSPGGVRRVGAGALRQPGDRAPDAAGRDGRLAEAAAAAVRVHCGATRGRGGTGRPGHRVGRLDALRRRPGRRRRRAARSTTRSLP